MRRLSLVFTIVPLLSACILSGCDSGNVVTGGDEKVTQVPMGDIDSAEGSISDEMINTDESTDEAPLDNSPVAAAAKPKTAAATQKKEDIKTTPPAASKPLETAAPAQIAE